MQRSKTILAALAALTLAAACSTPPPPPPVVAKVEPPAKVMMTITAKTPEAAQAVDGALTDMANVQTTNATAKLETALASDPDCALAHALLGSITPGNAGSAHLAQAETLAASLPAAEKAYITSMAADRRGEDQASLDALKAASAAAPDDWRVTFALGQAYFGMSDYENAGSTFKAAAALNPTAGPVQNSIGYLAMRQGKPDEAIVAFTKYTELSPTEANAQDSLAEALLAAGKFDDAEAGFQKALTLDPTFFPAWGGIAQARFLKGDWTGGREALGKSREMATRDQDKVGTDMDLAWSYLGEGKMSDAMKTLDAAEATAKDKNLEVAYASAPLERAYFLTLAGDAKKALPLIDEAMKRATASNLTGAPLANITRTSMLGRVEAYSKLGKAKEATDALAAYEAEMAKALSTPARVSQLAYARGSAALAAKDYKVAAEQFATCGPDDLMGHLQHVRALKLGGDNDAAAAAAQSLLAVNHRDTPWLWISSQARTFAPVATPAGT